MNASDQVEKTPVEFVIDAQQCLLEGNQSKAISFLCQAIAVMNGVHFMNYLTSPGSPPTTDPGLSHPCGSEQPTELRYCPTDNTTARYPCDPISAPLQDHQAAEELWACLKLISDKQLCSAGTHLLSIDTSVWREVQERAKALFPDRAL